MRRWFVIFLIVLLPWRAWAGDAMTLNVPTTPTSAAHCADHAVQATMPSVAPAPLAEHGSDHASASDAAPHAVCDICNGPAMTSSPPSLEVQQPLPSSRQSTDPVRFASALPRAGHKPPIA